MTAPDVIEVFIPVRPKVKSRPRFSRNGHAYTPQALIDYERLVADHFAELGVPPIPKEWDVKVELDFTVAGCAVRITPVEPVNSKLTGDIDNYSKAILDALNEKAYADDKQVSQLLASKA